VPGADHTTEPEQASPQPVHNGTDRIASEELNDSRHSQQSDLSRVDNSRPVSVEVDHTENKPREMSWPRRDSPVERSPEMSPVHRHSPSGPVPPTPIRERSSFLDRDRLLRRDKEPHSPPNVTVVQPSVSHPMLPYFHPSLYPGLSSSHNGLLATAPHLGVGMTAASQGLPGLHPFLPPTSVAGDIPGAFPNAMAAQAAAAWLSMNQGLLLNSHLAALGASSSWNPNLNLGGAFSHHSSRDMHHHSAASELSHRSHSRPVFVPPRASSPTRFTPYVIPAKSPEQRRSPLIVPRPEHSRRDESIRRDSQRESRLSPADRRSPAEIRHSPKDKHNVVNELRNIERMVNGLDR
jgi:hypothetical protein